VAPVSRSDAEHGLPHLRATSVATNPARAEVLDVLAETLWSMLCAGQAASRPTPRPARLRVAAPRISQPLDSQAV
jgi:hypothetical protein